MSKTPAAIRIDVDSARDITLLPELLDLLYAIDVKATLFITTGPARLALNVLKYLAHPRNVLKFIKSKPLRYGLDSFNGILREVPVEAIRPEVLRRAINEGHELGLHGYDHFVWINTLPQRGEAEIQESVIKGLKALQAAAQVEVQGFASPGFTITSDLIKALDMLGFQYSSDIKASRPTKPFYPQIGAKKSGVLQVPVSTDSIGELRAKGFSDDEIKARIKRRMDTWHAFRLPFVFYGHPAHEIGCYKKLFSSILKDLCKDERYECLTLAQIAEEWKGHV
jgi:peptidoglycan/xylan/chitin deacetylase (PgdA/CDA1 family)